MSLTKGQGTDLARGAPSCFGVGAGLSLALLASVFFAFPALAVENKPFTAPVTVTPPPGTQVNVEADVITFDPKTEIGTARGTIHLTYGPYTLDARRVSFNRKKGTFNADGKVVIHEPNGNVLLADTMAMRNKFRDGVLRHIEALLNNDGNIKATVLTRKNGTTFIYTKAHYTACKDCRTRKGEPMWEIVSDESTHDTKGHNLAHKNPRFKIAGVTVGGLPYLKMPDPSVTRRTGFLMPDFRAGSEFGFGLTTPYFVALGPSADITLRPLWTTKQGPVADVEFRQATENGQFNVRGYGVHQFAPQDTSANTDWRGAIDTHGAFRSGPNWTYGWNGTFASDSLFLGGYGYDGRRYAVNDVYTTGIWDQSYFSAQVLNFGSLNYYIKQDYLPQVMPFVQGDIVTRDAPIGGQFELSWNAYSLTRAAPRNLASLTSPPVDDNFGTKQTRATSQMNWHRQFYSDAGTVLTPFANFRSDVLISQQVPEPTAAGTFNSTSAVRFLPEAGFDARWPFVAGLPGGQSIISPVVRFVASANEGAVKNFGNEDAITLNYDSSSLFLDNRFSGLDRYEGGTHADIGVTYSFIGNNGGFIRAALGESIHIAGQDSFVNGSGLADNNTDLVGGIQFQPWSVFSLSYEARVRNDFSAINRQELVASLNFDRFSGNVSYLNFAAAPAYGLQSPTHWLSGDTRIRLNDGWSLFGGMTYDFTTGIFTRKTAGLEFDCKCMNLKLYYQSTQDSLTLSLDNRVQLSVEFATIGKTGFGYGF